MTLKFQLSDEHKHTPKNMMELNRSMGSQSAHFLYLDLQRQYRYKQTEKKTCTHSLPLRKTTHYHKNVVGSMNPRS